ncbi:MAG: HAD family hydrolase [Candidatus Hodarchaeota archaeon]
MYQAFKNAKGYIFDVDGTIMDSHDAHYRAWDRITRVHNLTYEKEQIVQHFGKTTPQIAMALFKRDDAEFIDAVSEEKEGYFIEEIPSVDMYNGAKDVFNRLKNLGKKTCLASSNVREAIWQVIISHGLEGVIDAHVGLDDIKEGKPDPEIIFKSAEMLGLKVSECIMVGDSIYDIQAGNAAGCFTVAVLTGIFSRSELKAEHANLVLEDVSKLLDYI